MREPPGHPPPPEHDYDIALSFAGENRDYVEEVAEGLRVRGVRVFYDRFEEVKLWGKDLYEYLDYVYRQAAQYCVLFVSKDYAEKVWPTHERQSAQARAMEENAEYVLPVRFDATEVPGLRPTVGYISADQHPAEEVVELIIEKLGPRERNNYLPFDLDRLFAFLGADTDDEKAEVRFHARSFFDMFSRLTPEEREIVFAIFNFGCPAEMPHDMHINLEYLRRTAGFEPGEVRALLRTTGVLGFEHRFYRDKDEMDNGVDELVELRWADRSVRDVDVPMSDDPDFPMVVADGMMTVLGESFCAQCAAAMIERCDFSLLESVTAGVLHPSAGAAADGNADEESA